MTLGCMERTAKIVTLRLDGLEYRHIAMLVDLSPSRVRQIVRATRSPEVINEARERQKRPL